MWDSSKIELDWSQDSGEMTVVGVANRDAIVGILGNNYNSVSFTRTSLDTFLIKYENKRVKE